MTAQNNKPSRLQISFGGLVREALSPEQITQLEFDLPNIFEKIDGERKLESIHVPQLFDGYLPDYNLKIVLAAEVQFDDGYERHIIKIGRRGKVQQDSDGWKKCTDGRMVASRMFAPVRLVDLELARTSASKRANASKRKKEKDDRCAVLYRDAFSLFGPQNSDPVESAPKLLEDAISLSVFNDEPTSRSAQRALQHLYTDLGIWFYHGATENDQAALDFYRERLRIEKGKSGDERDGPILELWEERPNRQEMRRHAAWLFRDTKEPGLDPTKKTPRYLDPVDFMTWATHASGRIPPTLVGRAHGDFHARNVLVGIRRGEIQYPAVFDYGEMSDRNVLAWDFAKLETEIKSRLLPKLIKDKSVRDYLIKHSELSRSKANTQILGKPAWLQRRADRMAAFLGFEELLDLYVMEIDGPDKVDRLDEAPARTKIEKLDRLIGILLRIRQEAAYWLGFQPSRRQHRWKDELYFALGMYGLLNVRWNYFISAQESALISAGVALAKMPFAKKQIDQAVADPPDSADDIPSYHCMMHQANQLWGTGKFQEGRSLVEEHVIDLVHTEHPPQAIERIDVSKRWQHAIPLIDQALLLQLEQDGRFRAVEPKLTEMLEEARAFDDVELIARVGRMYKDTADKKWEKSLTKALSKPTGRTKTGKAERRSHTRPAYQQMYDKSFDAYKEAFDITNDWYVGINAATLALLTGNKKAAKEIATEVAWRCKEDKTHQSEDRYWLFATEGEAALILGEDSLPFYRSAMAYLPHHHLNWVNSSYRQVCRLWNIFKETKIDTTETELVLEFMETGEAASHLKSNFLGRDFVAPAVSGAKGKKKAPQKKKR